MHQHEPLQAKNDHVIAPIKVPNLMNENNFWKIWRDPYLLAMIFSFNHGTNGDTAAEIGYLDGIVYNINLTFTDDAMDYASANGHLEVVNWLHENREEGCTEWAMDLAAANGHLPVVKWLHENRTEGCTLYAMNYAATNGHLHVVKWLYKNRTEGCTTYAKNYASLNDHIDVITWLYENC